MLVFKNFIATENQKFKKEKSGTNNLLGIE